MHHLVRLVQVAVLLPPVLASLSAFGWAAKGIKPSHSMLPFNPNSLGGSQMAFISRTGPSTAASTRRYQLWRSAKAHRNRQASRRRCARVFGQ